MKCFYHKSDFDGKCAGAIVKRCFHKCEMVGINYGERFPFETIKTTEEVFIVDFSIEPYELRKLNNMCVLTWIDHHKSAIDKTYRYDKRLLNDVNGIREVGKSGCELTWEFLYPDLQMPLFIKLLGRYDVWDHKDKRALPFQYGLRTYKHTKPVDFIWKELFSSNSEQKIINKGRTIIKYEDIQNEFYCNAASFEATFDNKYKVLAINKYLSNSKIFDSVTNKDDYDFFVVFGLKGSKFKVTLFSENFDVSKIAAEHGGGGHAGAAGFSCFKLPFKQQQL